MQRVGQFVVFPVYIVVEVVGARRSHRDMHDSPAERQTLRHVRPREITCIFVVSTCALVIMARKLMKP